MFLFCLLKGNFPSLKVNSAIQPCTLIFQSEELYSRKADAGIDYIPVTSSSIILNDGDMEGSIPLTVKADTIPELPETFHISLTKVELIGGPPANPSNIPKV